MSKATEEETKEPIALCKQGSDEVVAYACGKCGSVVGSVKTHGDNANREAAQCCGSLTCDKCGKPTNDRWNCWPCIRAETDKREQERFSAADDVTASYDGPVVIGDTYHHEICCASDAIDEPTWAWACREVSGIHVFAADIVEKALNEHCENAGEDVDVGGLQTLLDAWCAKQHVVSYIADDNRKVLIQPDQDDEEATA